MGGLGGGQFPGVSTTFDRNIALQIKKDFQAVTKLINSGTSKESLTTGAQEFFKTLGVNYEDSLLQTRLEEGERYKDFASSAGDIAREAFFMRETQRKIQNPLFFDTKKYLGYDPKNIGIVGFEDLYHRWYSVPERAYHNRQHADEVAFLCYHQTMNPATILAALYHDAVYIPGSSSNEKCSADALRYDAKTVLNNCRVVGTSIVDRACDLIQQTTIKHHLSENLVTDRSLAILLDSDLQSLSLPYSKFLDKQYDILEENQLNIGFRGNCVKVAEFLKQFLECREHIYHTEYMRKILEDKARANIIQLCVQCGVYN